VKPSEKKNDNMPENTTTNSEQINKNSQNETKSEINKTGSQEHWEKKQH